MPRPGERASRAWGFLYKGQWGYHPLVVSLANTMEPLYLVNRSGNRPSHDGAAPWINQAVALVRQSFETVCLRGDTDFVAGLKKISAISDISITTNGILLEAAAGALRRAGLQRINISLDTLDPIKYKQITRGGDLAAVLAGIHAARIEGLAPIKVNVVVIRGLNDTEITSFAALTMDRPVHIRFIELMPVNGQASWDKNCYISNADIMEKIQAIGELLPLPIESGAGPARLYQLRGAQGKLGFISPLSNHFCAACNRLRLTADGRLRTCLFSDSETDLRTPLRSGCNDADLLELLTQAILAKPLCHNVLDPSFKKCRRGMSAIGG